MWCPAHAYLETGKLDACIDYFCENAFARARLLNQEMPEKKNDITPPSD
jgi:hypothetical protein